MFVCRLRGLLPFLCECDFVGLGVVAFVLWFVIGRKLDCKNCLGGARKGLNSCLCVDCDFYWRLSVLWI